MIYPNKTVAYVACALFVSGCVGSSQDESKAERSSGAKTPSIVTAPPGRTIEPNQPTHPVESTSRADVDAPSGVTTGAAQVADQAATQVAADSVAVNGSTVPHSVVGRFMSAQTRDIRFAVEPNNRENYTRFDDNPVNRVLHDPVSTFSIDVDTASYSNMRRFLNQGTLPRDDAIRTEELINYFSYDYPRPDGQHPFGVYTEIGPSPWHADRHLLHIGLQGVRVDQLPPANLVFLVDVSGSMQSPDKIELLKTSLKLLSRQLRAEDTISIAVYAGAAGTVLQPTPGDRSGALMAALDRLSAGGSTNGGAGIRLAYSLARDAFIDGGINRVILATDGDFNVGTVNQQALKELIEDQRESGVGLTVLGFGTGNYNDALMQELAQAGNGNAAYIDTLSEARKVLVDEMSATLETIAKDVKIQVEFNPALVDEYRLIGYETRHLEREDFNNDKIDAGEIGAGHTVTALYEVTLTGSAGRIIDPLRYQPERRLEASTSDELAFIRLRYKQPEQNRSVLQELAVRRQDVRAEISETSETYRFSAAVAGFGQLLRGGRYTGDFDFADTEQLAAAAKGDDRFGYRGEFLTLVRTADALNGNSNATSSREISQR